MIASVLRKESRQNLKGKWKKALGIMLLFYMIIILLGIVVNWIAINTPYSLFAIILNIIIIVALNYGILVSFIKLKRNEKVIYLHFIYYAVKYSGKVWRIIGRLFLKLLPYIILWVLSIYLMITEFISLYLGYGMRLSYIIEILGVVILSILVGTKSLYYSMNNYILYDNSELRAKDILKESERLMKNHRWDLVKINLSFIGWFLLGILFSATLILTLFFWANIKSLYLWYITYIPQIFLLPYTYFTTICFYENLVYNNPKPKENQIINKKKKRKVRQKK